MIYLTPDSGLILLWYLAVSMLLVLLLMPVEVQATLSASSVALFGPDAATAIRAALGQLRQREGLTRAQQRQIQMLCTLLALAAALLLLPFSVSAALTVAGLGVVGSWLYMKSAFRGEVTKAAAIEMEDNVLALLSHMRLLTREGKSFFDAMDQYVKDFPHTILARELSLVLGAQGVGLALTEAFAEMAARYDNPYLLKLADAVETLRTSASPGDVLQALMSQLLEDFKAARTREIEQKVLTSLAVAVGGLIPALLLVLLEPAVYIFFVNFSR